MKVVGCGLWAVGRSKTNARRRGAPWALPTAYRLQSAVCGARCTFIASALFAIAESAVAHSPVFDCFRDDGDKVTCEGGFSDGASAAGVSVRVLDKSDRVLMEGKIDAEGRYSFKPPTDDFHIVFDAGAGHTVTIFGADIS